MRKIGPADLAIFLAIASLHGTGKGLLPAHHFLELFCIDAFDGTPHKIDFYLGSDAVDILEKFAVDIPHCCALSDTAMEARG